MTAYPMIRRRIISLIGKMRLLRMGLSKHLFGMAYLISL
jgi:hypothetical protein